MKLFGVLFKNKPKQRSLDIADLILRPEDIKQEKVIEIKHILSHVTYGGKEYTRYQVEQTDYVCWYEGHLNPYYVANLEYCEARQVQPPLFGLLNRLFHGTEPISEEVNINGMKIAVLPEDIYEPVYLKEQASELDRFKVGEKVLAKRKSEEEYREHTIIRAQVGGEYCVKGDRSDYDWGWTPDIKHLEDTEDELHGDNIPEG